MPAQTTRSSLVTLIILNLTLIGALAWFVADSIEVADSNAKLRAAIAEMEKEQSVLSGAKAGESNLKTALAVLSGFVVSPDTKINVIDTFEDLGEFAGVKYELKNAADTEPKISLDTTETGSFAGIYHFLKMAESSGYRVSYEKLSLARGDKGQWTQNLVLSIPQSKP